MRILYVLPFVPWVGRNRSYHMIPRLGKRHELFLLCRSVSAEEESRAKEMEPHCTHIRCVRHPHAKLEGALRCTLALPTPTPLRMAYFSSSRMKQAVRQASSEFSPDLIYIERWRTLQWIPQDIQTPILADPTDSMLLYNFRLMRSGSWWEKIIGLEETVKFLRYEPRLSERSAMNIYISCVDLNCVRKRSPKSRFAIVGNGVDIRKFSFKQPTEEHNNKLVFSGNFDYGPNRHAASFLLKKIFPIIRQRVPSAKLGLVGNRATLHYGHLNRLDNVEVIDFVPELRPYLAQARVAVAPMTLAVGVLTKILEAFAVGTPVVATSRACAGLDVLDGEHLLVENNAEKFAEKVICLLQDQQLHRYLALKARCFVEQNCDWDITTGHMERLMCELGHAKKQNACAEKTVVECRPSLQV